MDFMTGFNLGMARKNAKRHGVDLATWNDPFWQEQQARKALIPMQLDASNQQYQAGLENKEDELTSIWNNSPTLKAAYAHPEEYVANQMAGFGAPSQLFQQNLSNERVKRGLVAQTAFNDQIDAENSGLKSTFENIMRPWESGVNAQIANNNSVVGQSLASDFLRPSGTLAQYYGNKAKQLNAMGDIEMFPAELDLRRNTVANQNTWQQTGEPERQKSAIVNYNLGRKEAGVQSHAIDLQMENQGLIDDTTKRNLINQNIAAYHMGVNPISMLESDWQINPTPTGADVIARPGTKTSIQQQALSQISAPTMPNGMSVSAINGKPLGTRSINAPYYQFQTQQNQSPAAQKLRKTVATVIDAPPTPAPENAVHQPIMGGLTNEEQAVMAKSPFLNAWQKNAQTFENQNLSIAARKNELYQQYLAVKASNRYYDEPFEMWLKRNNLSY